MDPVRLVARKQRRVALQMTAVLAVMYLGFMLLVAFGSPILALQLSPGISVAIVIGTGMIVMSWLLGCFYVGWANRHHDSACDRVS